MQGWIPEQMWDEVANGFMILPEHGWAKNFVSHVQQLSWTLEDANKFVAWVEPPMGRETLPYMIEQATIYDRIRGGKAEAEMPSAQVHPEQELPAVGFDFKCDSCGQTAFVHHHSREEAIDIARGLGWLIRGTGYFGPDDCPICKRKLEVKIGRKIRGDGGYA